MLFLTGATGFIGSHFLRAAPPSLKIRCLVRPDSIQKLSPSPSLEIVPGDLLSEEPPDHSLQGVDCVVHLAALLRKQSPALIERVNVDATRRLAASAKKNGVKKFIFVSSENVMREDLDDAYAESKRRAESAVLDLNGHLILRPSLVYGRGDTHGLGRLADLIQKSPIVPLLGGLKCRVQPLYIDDMTEYLWRGVQNEITGTYVLAGSDAIGLNELIKKICALRGSRRSFLNIPYWVCRSSAVLSGILTPNAAWGPSQFKNVYGSRVYSMDESVRAFGYRPRSLEDGLSRWLSLL